MKILSADYSLRDFICMNIVELKGDKVIILDTLYEDAMFLNENEVLKICKEKANEFNCVKTIINGETR